MDSVMTIFPDAGQAKEIAALLLELADHPSQVATTLDPGLGFIVPQWLYETFVQTWDLRNSAPLAGSNVGSDDAEPQAAETPARRKPGRPRKES